eukprot:8368243-Alexandrium_andersonii.AAC.1
MPTVETVQGHDRRILESHFAHALRALAAGRKGHYRRRGAQRRADTAPLHAPPQLSQRSPGRPR